MPQRHLFKKVDNKAVGMLVLCLAVTIMTFFITVAMISSSIFTIRKELVTIQHRLSELEKFNIEHRLLEKR